MAHSRPVLRSESACHLHLSISPLVLALQAKSGLVFENSQYFCSSSPPSPLSTTVRTSWKAHSRPVLRVEHASHLHSSIVPLVLALLAQSELIFEKSDSPPITTSAYVEGQPGLTLDIGSPFRLKAHEILKSQVHPNNLSAFFKEYQSVLFQSKPMNIPKVLVRCQSYLNSFSDFLAHQSACRKSVSDSYDF